MNWNFSTPAAIRESYESGFIGAIADPDGFNRLREESRQRFGAAPLTEIAGSGEGKLSIPYVATLQHVGAGYKGRQTQGDCHVAGTQVSMADGSVRPIEAIQSGEYVFAPSGAKRQVLGTIHKRFNGSLVEITATGYPRPIIATPDHLFVTQDGWKAIGEITQADSVLLPYLVPEENQEVIDVLQFLPHAILDGGMVRTKHSRYWIPRYIKVDADLCYLLGVYLGDGGTDGNAGRAQRVTLNIGAHKLDVIEKAMRCVRNCFGIDAVHHKLPSKPNVAIVRIGCESVASLIKALIPGNVYSKDVPACVMRANVESRLECLRGWMATDGCLGQRTGATGMLLKATGVTAAPQLRIDMVRLAMSLRIPATMTTRAKMAHQRVPSGDVHFYGPHAAIVCPKASALAASLAFRPKTNRAFTDAGIMARVKTIIQHGECECDVYCLTVEEEHAFVANGYAVHNCVSWATATAALTCAVSDIVVRGDREAIALPIATEPIYGLRGHSGEGASCATLARAVCEGGKGGLLLRQPYPDIGEDFTTYAGQKGSRWGGRGTPEKINEEARKHQIKAWHVIESLEEVRDLLANGYGISTCSGYSFSDKRDEWGVSDRTRAGWSHAMSWCGCDDRPATHDKYGDCLICIDQSWGNWNNGGWHADYGPMPEGAFWILGRHARGMISSGGSIGFSTVNGWPSRKMVWHF